MPANKSHLIGEQVLNVGFKNQMLFIFAIPELEPLVNELKLVKLSTPKNMAKDDAIDSCRYAASTAPIYWSVIGEKPAYLPPRILSEGEERLKFFKTDEDPDEIKSVEDELAHWDRELNPYDY